MKKKRRLYGICCRRIYLQTPLLFARSHRRFQNNHGMACTACYSNNPITQPVEWQTSDHPKTATWDIWLNNLLFLAGCAIFSRLQEKIRLLPIKIAETSKWQGWCNLAGAARLEQLGCGGFVGAARLERLGCGGFVGAAFSEQIII